MNEKKDIVQRTHDSFYLSEDRYDNPKEMFKFLTNKIIINVDLKRHLTICDFGCAAGEFLFYLQKTIPGANLHGVDVLSDLIDKCKKMVPSASLIVGSVLDPKIKEEDSIDISFLIGVHSIFDEFETCFSNLIKWTKKNGGLIFILGMFNPYPVDVLVKYKESKNYDSNIDESGWNIFSQQSVSEHLKNNAKVKSFSFEKFEISMELPKQEDYIRSWTVRLEEGENSVTNGLLFMQPLYLLRIEL